MKVIAGASTGAAYGGNDIALLHSLPGTNIDLGAMGVKGDHAIAMINGEVIAVAAAAGVLYIADHAGAGCLYGCAFWCAHIQPGVTLTAATAKGIRPPAKFRGDHTAPACSKGAGEVAATGVDFAVKHTTKPFVLADASIPRQAITVKHTTVNLSRIDAVFLCNGSAKSTFKVPINRMEVNFAATGGEVKSVLVP